MEKAILGEVPKQIIKREQLTKRRLWLYMPLSKKEKEKREGFFELIQDQSLNPAHSNGIDPN